MKQGESRITNMVLKMLGEETQNNINNYVEEGIFTVCDDVLKINVPVISSENYKEFKNKIVSDKDLINTYKELYNGIYMQVRSLIPSYLEKQTPFIIQSLVTDRSYILYKAYADGIIKADTSRKTFIYNGFIIK